MQPRRFSNSFSKEDIEVIATALERTKISQASPGGLALEDYEALMQVVSAVLRGGDTAFLVRSERFKRTLAKLEGLKTVATADMSTTISTDIRDGLIERMTKMLERARLAPVIQAGPEERQCG